nr:S24 family peptidase [Vibrio mediterranei]
MLSTNIRARLRALGMTQKVLAEKAGISQVMVHKLLSGKTKSTAKIIELAKALECDPGWLQTGITDANPKPHMTPGFSSRNESGSKNNDEISIPFVSRLTLTTGGTVLSSQQKYEAEKLLHFQKSALVNAGVDWNNAICVNMTGNSMVPVLLNGSTVGINCSDTDLISGKIYAINHAGELFIKRLYSLPNGGLRVYSFNEIEYPPREYSKEQIAEESIVILGKIFWYSVFF